MAFLTFIELEPYDPAGYARLGYIYYSLREYQQAADTFERVILIKPEETYYIYQAARCYALLRDYDMALSKARQALKLDPNLRFVITDEPEFRDFRRSKQFKELLTELGPEIQQED